ncbi:MAG: phosphatidate cytidylyltransferase [Planctomycetales bacterium]|nr:phosphatidate cytidylyltransferase [Planctomycetales bacterium]
MFELASKLLWPLLAVFAALLVGSVIRLLALRRAPPDIAQLRRGSLLVWWILLLLLTAALLLGKAGLATLLCLLGVLAVREFQQLFAKVSRDAGRLAWVIIFLGVGHYSLLVFTASWWPLAAFPWLALVGISSAQILAGRTDGYLRTTAGYWWAAMLFFLGPSYGIVLMQLPAASHSLQIGPLGWPLFVLLLTEADDIAQALWGRRLGRHRMLPTISPGKSWEGFAGGLVSTTVLACGLAPWLTGLTAGRSWGAGLALSLGAAAAITLAGFLGDVNMSALKREAGVKDSGSLLPGMGGIIDRLDSLTLTAPAMYYYALACA